jgi:hypothetical protein
MAEKTFYVLDANVYINAHRDYYSFDLNRSFWNHLIEGAKTGQVVSIDRVKLELKSEREDSLWDWACNECDIAFASTARPDVTYHYGKIVSWVQQADFTDHAKQEFAKCADGWLIAYAKAAGHVVVTHESYEQFRKNRVKIPNVCKQFGVRYINTFEMLRELKFRLD